MQQTTAHTDESRPLHSLMTFASADGWHTGTTGRVDAQPDGQQAWAWASTVPYRDQAEPDAFQFPPAATLGALPPDGIVVVVQLYGPDARGRGVPPPFRLAQAANETPWEGQVRDIPLYRIGGRVPGQPYDVDISIFVGRAEPTREQLARADEELRRLNLPDWSSVAG